LWLKNINLRRAASVAAAKVAGRASRVLGKGGGTALPGLIALAIDPHVVSELASQIGEGSVVVSGTNGKTTTSRILAAIATKAGLSPLRNDTGSNLMRGLGASLIRQTAITGNLHKGDHVLGLFEVDEAALPEVLATVKPRSVLLLDLFRDQLDRYGEVATLARLWESAVSKLPSSAGLVANADDPLVTEAASKASGDPLYFGIESTDRQEQIREHASDVKSCPRCSGPIAYSVIFLGHLGHYRCSNCTFARPTPAVRAESVELMGMEGSAFRLVVGSQKEEIRYPLPGLYNVYNALGAAALALGLDVPLAEVKAGLERFSGAFGRFERIALGDRRVLMLLIKNPAGANEVVRTIVEAAPPQVAVVALNDAIADGRDVSWIWDVDFEPLLDGLVRVVATGSRAAELALRFAYGGMARGRIDVIPSLEGALDRGLELTPAGGELMLLPTYTAMLALRRIVAGRGHVKDYWEPAA
jgi:lipid II isoglutaminyl synthase (glutamine-hydrolysing)